MSEGVVLDPTRLIAGALIGLIILLILIIKFKVQAMIAILVGAISIGIVAGMPLSDIITSVNDGIGNTLKGIALQGRPGIHVRRHTGSLGRSPDPGRDHGKEIRG